MDDIFKSKDDMDREEKINNLFKSTDSIENIKEKEPAVAPESEKIITEKPKKNWKILAHASLVLFFLGLAAATGFFWWQYKKVVQKSAIAPVSEEAGIIVEKIKTSVELPPEKPVLATIADQEEITEQSFFPQALAGDKILVYIQSKKAILYRPSSNEVVETISLLSDKTADTKEGTSAVGVSETPEKIEAKVKVDVLNGTEIKGLAKETADKLSGMENVELAKTGNAQKSDYTKILVIDLSGKNETAAKIIAQKLGGEVGSLPEGETKGTADILVIAGKM